MFEKKSTFPHICHWKSPWIVQIYLNSEIGFNIIKSISVDGEPMAFIVFSIKVIYRHSRNIEKLL